MRTSSLALVFSLCGIVLAGCGGDDDAGGGGSSSGESSTSSGGASSSGGSSSGASSTSGGPPPPTHTDGIKNLDETDIDCGGAGAPKCADEKGCKAPTDCTSKVCTADKCAVPTKTDGVQNGDETDVDCGGTATAAPKCVAGKACTVNDDCASIGCNYAKKCAAGRSCTLKSGGSTCGAGETGTAQAAHEDCCARVDSATGPSGAFKVDKYLITAGRMRSFLDALNGKVRDYFSNAATKPAGWDATWTPYLPNALDTTGMPGGEHPNIYSAYAQVAGGIIHDSPGNQGCYIGTSTGHPTFFVPKATAENIYGDSYQRWMTQEQLDERALNCTTIVMLAALCAYDGGRLISRAEYDFIYDQDGTGAVSKYPWGATPNVGGYTTDAGGNWVTISQGGGACTSPACELDFANWSFNYQHPVTPAAPANADRDQANFISAPGRFPKGASRALNADPSSKVHDIAGLMIEATSTLTANKSFLLSFGNGAAGDDRTVTLPGVVWRGGSWEGHGIPSTWQSGEFTIVTKYGKTGSRCVYQ